MITEQIRTEIERATVIFPQSCRVAVLVSGGVLLTCEGQREDGDIVRFTEAGQAACGELLVGTMALDTFNDIAVLGPVETCDPITKQIFSVEAEKFERFCEETRPVLVSGRNYRLFQPHPAFLCTHGKNWIPATIMRCDASDPRVVLFSDVPIVYQTAGCPVLNDAGELIGIVSRKGCRLQGEQLDIWTANVLCPGLALPVWVCDKIFG